MARRPRKLTEAESALVKLMHEIMEEAYILRHELNYLSRDARSIPKRLRFLVLQRDQSTCQYCGRMAPDVPVHVDHIVPVAKGGTSAPSNLQTTCEDCNLGKHDSDQEAPPQIDRWEIRERLALLDGELDRCRFEMETVHGFNTKALDALLLYRRSEVHTEQWRKAWARYVANMPPAEEETIQ